jgi:Phage capsid family
MAGITLAQSASLTNDQLQAGVIQTMATESKLLAVLPFLTVEGHGYSYNVETSLAGVEFRGVNQAYNTTAPATERKTEYLTILGGEAVVDSFQMEVHSNINDLMAVQVALTAKAIAHKYEKTFLNGDSAVNSNEFDGLIKRAMATAIPKGSDIVGDIDILLDSVQGGADALIMNKATRRALTAVARQHITYKQNEFGVQVAQFGGVDIIDVESEILANDIIIAVKFGVHEAVCGLQSRSGVKVKPLGELGETPQVKTRIEWFCGMAVFNPKTVAMRKATA